jgi:hypothetical protein
VFPRLQNKFPQFITTHADTLEGPMTHWLHEEPAQDVKALASRMWNFLRWHDGTHVLLADKTEAGWFYIQDRGTDANVTGEFTPEHVHHNYLHTDLYKKSRAERGVEGANHGEFLPRNKFSTQR